MDLEAVEGMIHNDEWATNYVDDAEEEEYGMSFLYEFETNLILELLKN